MMIETQNLTKRFRRHEVVSGVSLNVPRGAALALIGANGAGKSTLLRLLTNVLQPDSGSARVLGVESNKLTHRDFQHIGYVAENAKLPERLTVAQYFDYLCVLYPSWDRALENDLRSQLDLPATRVLGKLSHGMRMKTMLAGALAFRPKLLLLDEPLSGLDPLVRDEMMEGLLRQADETTCVISSHELAEIEHSVTHVAFMDRGKLLFQESVEAMAARFREVDVVLGEDGSSPVPPPTWLCTESSNRALRFVETDFANEDELRRRVSTHCGGVQRLEARAMSLRDISKALMRAARKETR